MFSFVSSIAKAAVSVAAAPVALVADLATLPASAEGNGSPFSRTEKMLTAAGQNLTNAVRPE